MGREAYRMGVKFFDQTIAKSRLINELQQLGAYNTQKGEFGNIEMEFSFSEGYLEVLISNPREHKELLNEVSRAQGANIASQSEMPDITTMEMRFAKLNSIELVDRIIELMKKLKESGIITKVGDLEVKETINLDDFYGFKERVRKAKEEFEKWHHPIPYPVRCSEVYDTLHKMYPNEYRVASSTDEIMG